MLRSSHRRAAVVAGRPAMPRRRFHTSLLLFAIPAGLAGFGVVLAAGASEPADRAVDASPAGVRVAPSAVEGFRRQETKSTGGLRLSRAGGRTVSGEWRAQRLEPGASKSWALTPSPPILVPFDVAFYGLDLVPDVTRDSLSGIADLEITVSAADLTSITLDAVDLEIESVRANGRPRFWARPDSATLEIEIGSDIPGDSLRQPGEIVWISIRYSATPRRGYYSTPANSFTFSEPEDARYWFPCVDAPRDKARFRGWFSVPDGYTVGGNGRLVGIEARLPSGNGPPLFAYEWREDHPIATYLISMTIARYAVLHDQAGAVPLLYLVQPVDTVKARADFARVPEMMERFSAWFSPYPFDKYGMAAVEGFPAGGMEHQSMTTINRLWLRGDRTYEFGIAHELAHQWFGDSVTPYDWRDIWLNEGFATYGEALWIEASSGIAARNEHLELMAARFFAEFELDRYAVTDPPPDFLFGATVYDKGAWALHMLRRQVGDSAFFEILRRHASDNRYGNSSTGRFRVLAEEVSGQDLAWFFDQWLDGIGYPVFEFWFESERENATAGAGWRVRLHVRQAQVANGLVAFQVPLDIAVRTPAGESRFSITSRLEQETFDFLVPAQPLEVKLDPDAWVLGRVMPRSGASGEPLAARIEALFPNPTPGSATLRVRVPQVGPSISSSGVTVPIPIRVELFDLRGRKLRTVLDQALGPGLHGIALDGRDAAGRRLASGIYWVRVVTPEGESSRRLALLP